MEEIQKIEGDFIEAARRAYEAGYDGVEMWDYKVRKATVLYFALEDDYPRLQKRLFQMFGAEETGNLYFATRCV